MTPPQAPRPFLAPAAQSQQLNQPPPVQQNYVPPAQLQSWYWNAAIPGAAYSTPNARRPPFLPSTSTSNPFDSDNVTVPIDPALQTAPMNPDAMAFIQETPSDYYSGSPPAGCSAGAQLIPQPNFHGKETEDGSGSDSDASSSNGSESEDGGEETPRVRDPWTLLPKHHTNPLNLLIEINDGVFPVRFPFYASDFPIANPLCLHP